MFGKLGAIILIAQSGAWSLAEQVDPITDQYLVAANLSQNGNKFGIACARGIISISFSHRNYLGDTRRGGREVIYRFDQHQPLQFQFTYQNDKSAVTSNSIVAESVLRQLAYSERLSVRLFDYRGYSHDALFDLPENREEVQRVMDACRIELD